MKHTDYKSFSEHCVDQLLKLQEKWFAAYDIESYENWYYDQATELLTFSNGDREINFKFFVAGTFSLKQKTWRWAWSNESMLPTMMQKSVFIKEIGEDYDFEKLVNPCFECDEADAWELASVATYLGGGIGVYRPVGDDRILMFLIVTEIIDNKTAQKIKDMKKEKYVGCNKHGQFRNAFVCQHLTTSNVVGFEEAFETSEGMELEEDDDFQAWCSECEKVRFREGEWNDISMEYAQIKLICEKCYFDIKELNLGHR